MHFYFTIRMIKKLKFTNSCVNYISAADVDVLFFPCCTEEVLLVYYNLLERKENDAKSEQKRVRKKTAIPLIDRNDFNLSNGILFLIIREFTIPQNEQHHFKYYEFYVVP